MKNCCDITGFSVCGFQYIQCTFSDTKKGLARKKKCFGVYPDLDITDLGIAGLDCTSTVAADFLDCPILQTSVFGILLSNCAILLIWL